MQESRTRGKATAEAVQAQPALTIGLDVADSYTQLCGIDAQGNVVESGRVRTTTAALQQRFATIGRTRLVLEAGPHSPWVSRLLAELGHEVIVANPRQVRLIGQSHRKSESSDAEQLARLGRFDPELLAPIRHRGPEAHADLATVRSRDALVRARTLLINHVRGAVKAWGGSLPSSTAQAFHRRAADQLPTALEAARAPLVEVVGELSARIKMADDTIEELGATRYPETQALRQVVGVGPLTALSYVLTIDDPRRFAASRDVGPYLGLVPRRRDSGAHTSQLGISKAGDTHLRRLLVGCAQYVLGPFGPDSDLRRWGERHGALGAKNARKRVIVAVARKLAVLLHALWISGEPYEPLRQAQAV